MELSSAALALRERFEVLVELLHARLLTGTHGSRSDPVPTFP
jgi:hypothetical protein